MKKFFAVFAAVFAGLLLCGCAASPEPILLTEVFQLKKDQKIRTAYNIWYTDPENVDCRNVQQGSFIPLGTEITPVSADNTTRKITFKAQGKPLPSISKAESASLPCAIILPILSPPKRRKKFLKISLKMSAAALNAEKSFPA